MAPRAANAMGDGWPGAMSGWGSLKVRVDLECYRVVSDGVIERPVHVRSLTD